MKPGLEFGISGTKAVISSPVKTTKVTQVKHNDKLQQTVKAQKKQPLKTSKPVVIKKEQKIVEPVKIQVKQQQKQEPIVLDTQPIPAPQKQQLPTPIIIQTIKTEIQPLPRLIQINYSHYKDKFQSLNNLLSFKTIDDKYCLSFVFKGNFIPKLKNKNNQTIYQNSNNYFQTTQDTYILQIQQDDIEQSKYQHKPYISAKQPQVCKTKKRVQQLTNDLKGLNVQQIQSKSDKYKQLIEQRDLQDILYK